jgi:GTP cyclohydrolase IB
MIDVQKQPGLNDIDIDKVGVCDVHYPIVVMDKKAEKQSTTALIKMYVGLPHQFKVIHTRRYSVCR